MFRPTLHSSLRILRSTAPRTLLSNRLIAHRFLSQEARSTIQRAIDSSPVVLFMKGTRDLPECGFSRAVVQVLSLHGVPDDKLQTFNVLADAELRAGIKEFSDWPTIPQVYVNGEFIGGCDILLGMHQSGQLEKLLIDKKIIPEELPEEVPSQAHS